jgi:serine/threonine-protein kinase
LEAKPEGSSGAEAVGGVTAEAGEAPVNAWLFAGLTLASTAVFSALAALVLRGMGVW